MKLTKEERRAIEVVLHHCAIDISYDGGGTFNKHDNDHTFDEKEAARAKLGIWTLRKIINSLTT